MTEDSLEIAPATIGYGSVLAVFATYLAAQSGVILFAAQFTTNVTVLVVAHLLGSILTACLVVLLTKRLSRALFWEPSSRGVGWIRPTRLLAICSAICGLALGATVGVLGTLWPIGAPPNPQSAILTSNWAILLLLCSVAVIAAPICEETLFRGLLMARISPTLGRAWGVVISSCAFVTIHLIQFQGYWVALLGVSSLGVLTAVARMKSGSLITAIIVHASYNAVLLPFSIRGQ